MIEASIRRMNAIDIDAVVNVEQQTFSTPWSRESFANEMSNELCHYIVILVDGKIIGYAGMWIIVDEAHITNVAIIPEYRGKGLGEKLMRALMESAKSRGAGSMTLEVRSSNNTAQGLYRKLGFIASGVRRQYYRDNQEDALIMWCDKL